MCSYSTNYGYIAILLAQIKTKDNGVFSLKDCLNMNVMCSLKIKTKSVKNILLVNFWKSKLMNFKQQVK